MAERHENSCCCWSSSRLACSFVRTQIDFIYKLLCVFAQHLLKGYHGLHVGKFSFPSCSSHRCYGHPRTVCKRWSLKTILPVLNLPCCVLKRSFKNRCRNDATLETFIFDDCFWSSVGCKRICSLTRICFNLSYASLKQCALGPSKVSKN